MHGSIRRGRLVAISVGGKSAAGSSGDGGKATDKSSNGKSAVDDGDWFSRAARALHPHKAGTVLHLVTGLGDERLCQRYAAGDVKPPAYFLRALLRSDQGAAWLAAAMEGSDAAWWTNHQRAGRIAAALDAVQP